jgi:transcriptional regulator with XRE-family HTH domain
MKKSIENENKFYDDCFKAWELYQSKGKVTDKEIFKIAKEFGVDADELLREAKYEQRLTDATSKALDSIETIADEFKIKPEDLQIGIECHWDCINKKNLALALEKSQKVIAKCDNQLLKIANEFNVDINELLDEVGIYNEQETENNE